MLRGRQCNACPDSDMRIKCGSDKFRNSDQHDIATIPLKVVNQDGSCQQFAAFLIHSFTLHFCSDLLEMDFILFQHDVTLQKPARNTKPTSPLTLYHSRPQITELTGGPPELAQHFRL
jgi:hypothetical protein